MRQYTAGDPTTQATLAGVKAESQQAVVQAQGDNADDLAARRAGDISGTGTLTQYKPRGTGVAAGHLEDAVRNGVPLGGPSSYDYGKGAPEPVQIIRGTKSTYQIAGKDTGAPDREGTGPVDSATVYGDGGSQSLPVFASGYNPQPGTGREFASPEQAQQEFNRGRNLGEYKPLDAESLALKHGYTMKEIEAKDKMSGGDAKEAAALRQANVGTFETGVAAEPHYIVDDGKGKKVLHPYVDKMSAFYSGQVAAGKMAPDEAVRQLNDHVIPQLYSEKVGTPQLAANQVAPFVAGFKKAYGVDLPPAAVNAYLSAGSPTKPDGTVDTVMDRQRQILILKTLSGSQDIPAAQGQKLLALPSVAAGKVTAAPGTAPSPGKPPAAFQDPALQNFETVGRGATAVSNAVGLTDIYNSANRGLDTAGRFVNRGVRQVIPGSSQLIDQQGNLRIR